MFKSFLAWHASLIFDMAPAQGVGVGFFQSLFVWHDLSIRDMTRAYIWHDLCIRTHRGCVGVFRSLFGKYSIWRTRTWLPQGGTCMTCLIHIWDDALICEMTYSCVRGRIHTYLRIGFLKKKKWVIYGANWLLSPNNMIRRTHPRLPQGRASLICLIHVWDDAFIRENTHSEVRWLVHAYLHVGFWNQKRASNLGSLLIVATAW